MHLPLKTVRKKSEFISESTEGKKTTKMSEIQIDTFEEKKVFPKYLNY